MNNMKITATVKISLEDYLFGEALYYTIKYKTDKMLFSRKIKERVTRSVDNENFDSDLYYYTEENGIKWVVYDLVMQDLKVRKTKNEKNTERADLLNKIEKINKKRLVYKFEVDEDWQIY